MTDENKNMELWRSVCDTDPAITTQVNQRGGFTAICAQYQRRAATEKWGPYGMTWGLKEVKIDYVKDENGKCVEAYIECHFFFPEGQFFISSDIKYNPGMDTRKKLMTDVTTKALSFLGFNSDVFEGRFDDNKYLEKQTKKYSKAQKARDIISALEEVLNNKEKFDKYLEKVDVCLEKGEINEAGKAQIMAKVKAWESAKQQSETF